MASVDVLRVRDVRPSESAVRGLLKSADQAAGVRRRWGRLAQHPTELQIRDARALHDVVNGGWTRSAPIRTDGRVISTISGRGRIQTPKGIVEGDIRLYSDQKVSEPGIYQDFRPSQGPRYSGTVRAKVMGRWGEITENIGLGDVVAEAEYTRLDRAVDAVAKARGK